MAPIKKRDHAFFAIVTISFICQMITEVVATRQEFVLGYMYNRAFERSYESPAIMSVCFSVYPTLRSLPILPHSNNSNKQHTFSGVSLSCIFTNAIFFPKFAVRYNTALFSNIYVGDGVVSIQSGPLIL